MPGEEPSRRTFLQGITATSLGIGLAGVAYSQRDQLVDGETTQTAGHTHARRLVPDDQVTHRATGGNWTETESWETLPPDEGAHVQIPRDVAVTLDAELTTELDTVRVDGTLRVDPTVATRLLVDTLVITGSGTLEIGTRARPVQRDAGATLTFLDDGPIDESWDPQRVSRGLLALPGSTVRLAGAQRTPWTATATHPMLRDRSLSLETPPTDWDDGDRLVLAGLHPDVDQDEQLTVAGVAGSTVNLSEPLIYDHVPPRDSFDAYVASRDRAVTLRSASEATKRRGHVMFMTTDVRVSHVAFDSLGRTDKSRPITDPVNGTPPAPVTSNLQARYACHFHRTGVDGDTDPAVVEGCIVDGSPGWGYVNHHSNVVFRDNVSYDVFGAGFVAEAGAEIGSFERNFALRSTGSGDMPDGRQFDAGHPGATDDFGHGGYGFWLQSPGVTVDDNVAAGHRHHGFVWWLRPKAQEEMDPERFADVTVDFVNYPIENVDGQDRLVASDAVTGRKVPSTRVRIRSFEGNTVFASGGGVDISRHRLAADHDEIERYSVVDNFTAYNIGAHFTPWDTRRVPNSHGAQGGQNGISIRYSAHILVRNPTLVAGDGGYHGVAINRNLAPTAIRIEEPDIEGWFTGIRAFPRGTCPIRNGQLDNHIDVHAVGGGTHRRWDPPQYVPITDVTFGDDGRASVFVGTNLNDDLYGALSPAGGVELDGTPLSFDSQRPDFVPYPTDADLGDPDPGELGSLTDAAPADLVGKSNRELAASYGLAVEGRVVENAAVPETVVGGSTIGEMGSGDATGGIQTVHSTIGSVYELGTLQEGVPLYVYDDVAVHTLPEQYSGVRYLRPEKEDADIDRVSAYRIEFADPADVFVAYDAESTPGWLSEWTDTGDRIGTEDGPRRVFKQSVDAGIVWLGACPDTYRMYSVFWR